MKVQGVIRNPVTSRRPRATEAPTAIRGDRSDDSLKSHRTARASREATASGAATATAIQKTFQSRLFGRAAGIRVPTFPIFAREATRAKRTKIPVMNVADAVSRVHRVI